VQWLDHASAAAIGFVARRLLAEPVVVLVGTRGAIDEFARLPEIDPEYRDYGYEFPDGAQRVHELHEAVQIILSMWTNTETTFQGDFYQVRHALNDPKGVQKPHVPLLIGGGGEKGTLRLVAEYGDACNVVASPSELAASTTS
jgi:alkanesulfonate monooxygenase SsuD/methylene tetrahydromethanopterin reductase-like flavin-dependent oxidoreductase (luciferase family)